MASGVLHDRLLSRFGALNWKRPNRRVTIIREGLNWSSSNGRPYPPANQAGYRPRTAYAQIFAPGKRFVEAITFMSRDSLRSCYTEVFIALS